MLDVDHGRFPESTRGLRNRARASVRSPRAGRRRRAKRTNSSRPSSWRTLISGSCSVSSINAARSRPCSRLVERRYDGLERWRRKLTIRDVPGASPRKSPTRTPWSPFTASDLACAEALSGPDTAWLEDVELGDTAVDAAAAVRNVITHGQPAAEQANKRTPRAVRRSLDLEDAAADCASSSTFPAGMMSRMALRTSSTAVPSSAEPNMAGWICSAAV